jgi:tetratricopeptide (TPR) repeat protein
MTRQQGAAFATLALLALFTSATAPAQDDASANALQRWIAAVNEHKPGSADNAAGFVVSMTFAYRLELDPAMTAFLKRLSGQTLTARTAPERRIFDLYNGVRVEPGLTRFIRRAVILHTDAAIFAGKFPPGSFDLPPAAVKKGATHPASPLLSNRRAVVQRDGVVIGEATADWNWPFARSLLDLVMPAPNLTYGPPRDPKFGAAWYHATNAYLMGRGDLADLRLQMQRAAAALPDEPRVLFDRGCYAEALGLPYNQTVRDDPALRTTNSIAVDLPSEESANGEAERLFTRAIAFDDRYAEAHVRLARLLERGGRHDDAAAEAALALASPHDRVVAFYAHIVSGRIAFSRGRVNDSLDHYAAAAALFPDAQSALLGASQAALMSSNVDAAMSFIQRLSPRSREMAADPWWSYRLCAGRDVDALMNALWSGVRMGDP